MRKIIFFSLIFLCLLSNTASAVPDWKDTIENYPTGSYSDYWTPSITNTNNGGTVSFTSAVSQNAYPDTSTHCLLVAASMYVSVACSATSTMRATTNDYLYEDYAAFTSLKLTKTDGYSTGGHSAVVRLLRQDGTAVASYTFTEYSSTVHVFEIIETGGAAYLYKDGVSLGTISNGYYTSDGIYQLQFYTYAASTGYKYGFSTNWYLDDISTESCIGVYPEWNEYQTDLIYSYRIQGIYQHPEYNYTASLTSLYGDSPGLINTSILSSDTASGFVTVGISSTLGSNYGLYRLSLNRDAIELDSAYFVYSLSTDPIPYPEILLLAGANVAAEIRDDNNNGGVISAGDSVYLYPETNENGTYNITYDILETPFSIEAEISKIFATSPLNETNIIFSGLSAQSYYVSVDGMEINSTKGGDTWDYQFTEFNTSHIISFDLDYTVPGVWGYVKNSETQNPLKSATVTISNSSNTYYLFSDSNGMYYKTKDMITGSYNVSAAKSGYTASVSYNVPTQNNSTSRQDIFLDPIEGAGVYYAAHDVTFTVLEYWYSSVGLQDVTYAVYDDENETVKTGITGTKGTFSVKDMDQGIKYTIVLTYNGNTYTEYIEPGLTEYNLVLNKEGIIHEYYNSWLTLTYAETPGNVSVLYDSNKTITEASLTVTASNGTIVQAETLNTTSGTFTFSFTDGDYIMQFNIEASDGSTASQAWSISYPSQVTLFPASYPTWLKNTLFVAIIIIFLLAFGKSKNDIACGAVAVLTSLGHYFQWLTCSFNFVVLIWIIALGAIFLHYKRTGAVG